MSRRSDRLPCDSDRSERIHVYADAVDRQGGLDRDLDNKDDEPHTVVSDTGEFKSGGMDTNESFSHKFDKPAPIILPARFIRAWSERSWFSESYDGKNENKPRHRRHAGGRVIGAGLFIESGSYNIGADDHHTKIVLAVIDQLRERSIGARARTIDLRYVEDL